MLANSLEDKLNITVMQHTVIYMMLIKIDSSLLQCKETNCCDPNHITEIINIFNNTTDALKKGKFQANREMAKNNDGQQNGIGNVDLFILNAY